MAKQIELEYFSMIDQVVFACDDSLNILYNNYHERFYEKIMRPIEEFVNLKLLRSKSTLRLDRFFVQTKRAVQTDTKTMRKLLKIYETFEFDPLDIGRLDYFRSVGILDILEALEVYERKIRRNIGMKSTRHLKMEKRRKQMASIQLLVS